jgi:hypothetical protein
MEKTENKTAVEWLEEQLNEYALIKPSLKNGYNTLVLQAKKKELQQKIKLANHLRNNYQPLAPNQAEWQRYKDKKVVRIEEIIDELNEIN